MLRLPGVRGPLPEPRLCCAPCSKPYSSGAGPRRAASAPCSKPWFLFRECKAPAEPRQRAPCSKPCSSSGSARLPPSLPRRSTPCAASRGVPLPGVRGSRRAARAWAARGESRCPGIRARPLSHVRNAQTQARSRLNDPSTTASPPERRVTNLNGQHRTLLPLTHCQTIRHSSRAKHSSSTASLRQTITRLRPSRCARDSQSAASLRHSVTTRRPPRCARDNQCAASLRHSVSECKAPRSRAARQPVTNVRLTAHVELDLRPSATSADSPLPSPVSRLPIPASICVPRRNLRTAQFPAPFLICSLRQVESLFVPLFAASRLSLHFSHPFCIRATLLSGTKWYPVVRILKKMRPPPTTLVEP